MNIEIVQIQMHKTQCDFQYTINMLNLSLKIQFLGRAVGIR